MSAPHRDPPRQLNVVEGQPEALSDNVAPVPAERNDVQAINDLPSDDEDIELAAERAELAAGRAEIAAMEQEIAQQEQYLQWMAREIERQDAELADLHMALQILDRERETPAAAA